MKKRREIVVLIVVLSLFNPTATSAASNKDQALSLAASGCALGWLDSPLLSNLNNISFQVITTASASQWNDDTNNSFAQNHHTQILEGWNLAANLDPKWTKLANTYSAIYGYIGKEASRGTIIGEIWNSAERKYGGIVNANCKIAITSARSKAKASGKTFPRWIISTAGNLLPPLDPRTRTK
jgi:hypothetical protein